MVGVASQIIFCIFAAAIIGAIAGYVISGLRLRARSANIERLWQAKIDQRDAELSALRRPGRAGADAPEPSADELPSAQAIGAGDLPMPEATSTGDLPLPDATSAGDLPLPQGASVSEEPSPSLSDPNQSVAQTSYIAQFEEKLSEALSLIENLARSQERLENELIALRKSGPATVRRKSATPKI